LGVWHLLFEIQFSTRAFPYFQVFVHSFDENIGFDYRPQMVWDVSYAADLLISMKQTYTTEDAKQLSIGYYT
jgi:hypothetical protein